MSNPSPTQTQVQTPEVIRIDLRGLYELGYINMSAARVLEKLLEIYGIERYEILLDYNPDIGLELFVSDRELREKLESAEDYKEFSSVVVEYAVRRGAVAAVELYDGYERAYALVFSSR
jgi:hypothetical protein